MLMLCNILCMWFTSSSSRGLVSSIFLNVVRPALTSVVLRVRPVWQTENIIEGLRARVV